MVRARAGAAHLQVPHLQASGGIMCTSSDRRTRKAPGEPLDKLDDGLNGLMRSSGEMGCKDEV